MNPFLAVLSFVRKLLLSVICGSLNFLLKVAIALWSQPLADKKKTCIGNSLNKFFFFYFFPTLYQLTTVPYRNFQTVAALILYTKGRRGTASEVCHALLTLKHLFLTF